MRQKAGGKIVNTGQRDKGQSVSYLHVCCQRDKRLEAKMLTLIRDKKQEVKLLTLDNNKKKS